MYTEFIVYTHTVTNYLQTNNFFNLKYKIGKNYFTQKFGKIMKR